MICGDKLPPPVFVWGSTMNEMLAWSIFIVLKFKDLFQAVNAVLTRLNMVVINIYLHDCEFS